MFGKDTNSKTFTSLRAYLPNKLDIQMGMNKWCRLVQLKREIQLYGWTKVVRL